MGYGLVVVPDLSSERKMSHYPLCDIASMVLKCIILSETICYIVIFKVKMKFIYIKLLFLLETQNKGISYGDLKFSVLWIGLRKLMWI